MALPNPVEAEAIGQSHVTAEFGGHEWTIPLDVDLWPIDLVLNCVAFEDRTTFKVNHFSLVPAMTQILGDDQWEDFCATLRKRGDLRRASHAFAAAVGIPRGKSPLDVAFGAIPRLLLELRLHQDAVEATLGDLGVDYRDRWRFDPGQRRKLTLRQIHIRLRHAPFDSALSIAKNNGNRPHSGTELLLMDLWERAAGQPHPSRPMSAADRAKRESSKKAFADYRKRRPKNRVDSAIEAAKAHAQVQQREAAHAQ